MPSIFSGVESHVAGRIDETPASLLPFEHCVVDDVFPPDLFEAIHKRWPSDSVFMPITETGRTGGFSQRQVMLYQSRFFDKLSQADHEFWINVARAAMGGQVTVACYNKFKAVLQPRIKNISGDITLDPELLVVSDRSDYKIGPHTDSPARFVSLLYYLSPDPKYRSYGTGLYQPKDSFNFTNYYEHHDFKDFTLHTRVDFKPNRLVIFPRTNRSYHGVEPVPVESCDRRLLIVNIRAPKGAI